MQMYVCVHCVRTEACLCLFLNVTVSIRNYKTKTLRYIKTLMDMELHCYSCHILRIFTRLFPIFFTVIDCCFI